MCGGFMQSLPHIKCPESGCQLIPNAETKLSASGLFMLINMFYLSR